jgi:single-stranded-DNA-specific exonuclease
MTRDLQIRHLKTVGQDQQHLKLTLFDGRQSWSAIAFKQGYWAKRLSASQQIDAVYNLEFNEWNGERRMQLNIKDLRPSKL